VSNDGGITFERLFKGPIVDRTAHEPHWCSTPCVLVENEIWRMWYLNATEWSIINNRPEPYCHIKYAESHDGIVWRRSGHVAIERNPEEGGLAKPHVVKDRDRYRMWYARRGPTDYRSNPACSYRIGYAESLDGLEWERKDKDAGIDVSDSGWDSEMIS